MATQKMMQVEASDLGVLVEVAKLYYEDQLTQSEIGRRLDTSRSTVSRLLQEARDRGVVKITIEYQWARDSRLERELKSNFALKEVLVLRSSDRTQDEVTEGMGQLTANFLQSAIKPDMILGVSYGRSVAATVKHLKPTQPMEITVVQVIGALGSHNPLVEGADLARALADKYGGSYRYLYAPLVVEDLRTKDLLIQEPMVQDILSIGRQADIALFGIGALDANFSGLWNNYLTKKELSLFKRNGARGHMCAQFFDLQGGILDIPFNQRSISIGLDSLNQIPTVVTVAGGEEKATAILGALRGKFIDVLVTDDKAAQIILDIREGQ